MSTPIREAVVVDNATHNQHSHLEKIALLTDKGTPALVGSNLKYSPITVATAIGTVAKTTTSAEPAANTLVPIKFTAGNSAAAPTVAFAGGTARAIQLGGTAPLATELALAANGVALFWFDGTILHQIGMYA